jgi:hypothetical protein
MVTMISRMEKRVSRWEHIPGPSSQAENGENVMGNNEEF